MDDALKHSILAWPSKSDRRSSSSLSYSPSLITVLESFIYEFASEFGRAAFNSYRSVSL